MMDSTGMNGIFWAQDFEVQANMNGWQEHRLPFNKFLPTRRGQMCSGKLNLRTISSLAVMLNFLNADNRSYRSNP